MIDDLLFMSRCRWVELCIGLIRIESIVKSNGALVTPLSSFKNMDPARRAAGAPASIVSIKSDAMLCT